MFYVIIGVALSFFIAGYCEDEEKTRLTVFRKAFLFEFVFIFISGCFFFFNQRGYFENKEPSVEGMLLVIGFSLIMSVLVGLKSAYPHLK